MSHDKLLADAITDLISERLDIGQAFLRVGEVISEPQPNPHWAIEKVLSEPDVLVGVEVEEVPARDWWGSEPDFAEFADNMSGMVVRALELAVRARDSLLGLEVLASTTTWAALLTYGQVPSLATTGTPAALLCEAGEPGSLPSLRAASADIVNTLDARFQEFLTHRLLVTLTDTFGDQMPDGEQAISFAADCGVKKLSGGATLEKSQISEIYHAWREDHPSDEALARTLQETLTSAMGNKPREWFAAVGRHCGFVGPRRGHPARLRTEVALVPSLVLAGMEDSDGEFVEFATWSDRLINKFGIMFGPHRLVRDMGLRVAEQELEANRANLEQLLASLGLARRFSDGVTEVLNPLHVWTKS